MDVEIKLKGSGLEFFSKISLMQATQIIAFLARPANTNTQSEEEQILAPISGTMDTPLTNGSKYNSPREAINMLGAKTNPQKIVALALYLGITSQNNKLFSSQDIVVQFAKAGEKTPKNITRDLKDAVIAGYIYLGDEGKYRLLNSADTVATDGFKKIKKQKSKIKGSSKAGRKPAATVRSEVEQLAVSTSLESYPKFFDLSLRSDKILWILAYAKKNSIDGLNRTEIVSYSKKIGGKLNTQIFTSSNTPNIKGDFIYKKGDLILITNGGENHLKKAKENNAVSPEQKS